MPVINSSSMGRSVFGESYDSGKTWSDVPQQAARFVLYQNKADAVSSHRDASGWRSPLPYSNNGYHYTAFEGTMQSKSGVYRSRYTGIVQTIHAPLHTLVTPSWLSRKAEIDSLIKLKQMNVNLAVALAESRKTISLVGNLLERLTKSVKQAKRGNWKQAASSLGVPGHSFKRGSKDTAGRWLELQYGWMPLLGDIYALHQANVQGFFRLKPRLSVTKVVRQKIAGGGTETDGNGFSRKYSKSGYHLAKVRLDYELLSGVKNNAASYGLTNPLSVAWELTPWSFLVDWCIPIGDWISTMDAAFGLKFIGGSKTTFSKERRKWTCRGSKAYTGFAKADSETYQMIRSVYTKTPWTLPYFKSPVSGAHALNALALLRAQFK